MKRDKDYLVYAYVSDMDQENSIYESYESWLERHLIRCLEKLAEDVTPKDNTEEF